MEIRNLGLEIDYVDSSGANRAKPPFPHEMDMAQMATDPLDLASGRRT